MGRHLIAHEKARAAVAANPGDTAAQAAAALFKRRAESAAEAGPP
jgi:hypothetical protein